jgi:hypothetical protein
MASVIRPSARSSTTLGARIDPSRSFSRGSRFGRWAARSAAVGVDATAFAHRERKLIVSVVAAGFDRPELAIRRTWVERLASAMGGIAKGAYVNFLDDTNGSRVMEANPAPTCRRLAEVKALSDPTNVFRGNVNIVPHTSS